MVVPINYKIYYNSATANSTWRWLSNYFHEQEDAASGKEHSIRYTVEIDYSDVADPQQEDHHHVKHDDDIS